MNGSNVEVFDDYVVVRVDPKLFSLDVIFMAAYVMIGKAHVFLTGDPEKEIRVNLRKGDKFFGSLEDLGNEFNNELLTYQVYNIQSKRTADLRKLLLTRALFPTFAPQEYPDEEECKEQEELGYDTFEPNLPEQNESDIDKFIANTDNVDFEKDPDGITIPWTATHKEESKEFFRAVEETLGKRIITPKDEVKS